MWASGSQTSSVGTRGPRPLCFDMFAVPPLPRQGEPGCFFAYEVAGCMCRNPRVLASLRRLTSPTGAKRAASWSGGASSVMATCLVVFAPPFSRQRQRCWRPLHFCRVAREVVSSLWGRCSVGPSRQRQRCWSHLLEAPPRFLHLLVRTSLASLQ